MKRTAQQMLDALADLFDECPLETPEEVNAELEAFGYDLDELDQWAQDLADKVQVILNEKRRELGLPEP